MTANRAWWRMSLTSLAIAVVAYFLWTSISTQWDAVRSQPWSLHWYWLATSAAVTWFGVVWLVFLWRTVIVMFSGQPLDFWSAYRIAALSNLGKYIPGKLWSVMGLIYFLREEGHPTSAAIGATVLHQAYTLISGILFATLILGLNVWGEIPIAIIVGVLVASLTMVYPPVLERVLNFGLRLVRRDPVAIRLRIASAGVLYVGYSVAWVIYGAGFWMMSKAFGIPAGPFWPVVASYGGAYLAGFLALFAPGGLGVREGILALMLGPYLPPGLPAVVAVLSRLWMTAIELLGLLPLLFLGKKSKKLH